MSLVAPTINTPSLYHLYTGDVPIAVTLNVATVGEHIEVLVGCTVIAIASFTVKVAVFEVIELHAPITVTEYVPASAD